MDAFLTNSLSYPTVIFTVFAVFAFLYLVVAAVGLAGFDDVDLEFEALAGIMTTLGLRGVPLSIVMGLIALFAWAACYALVALFSVGEPGNWFNLLVGTLAIPVSLAAAVLLTAAVVRPLRPLFQALNGTAPDKVLLGATATIRTTRVDERFGEAQLQMDGADLIVKVRAPAEKNLKKGDKVVLVEHEKEQNLFWVVSVDEFKS
ncbi:MAG: hypothetical protein R3F38_11840 [Gammaproteobacteria bacterium]